MRDTSTGTRLVPAGGHAKGLRWLPLALFTCVVHGLALLPSSASAVSAGGFGAAVDTVRAPVAAESRSVVGSVSFDCLLQPFQSGFRYEAKTSMVAARSAKGDPEVELSASFSDLPGISPAQIDDGEMTIVAKGEVDGAKFKIIGTSVVNTAPKEPVPMPRAIGSITSSADALSVELTEFSLRFNEMMGLTIKATCLPTNGGGLGTLKVRSGSTGDLKSSDAKKAADDRAADDKAADDKAAEPEGEGGSAMSTVFAALWVAGGLGAGLLVWLAPRRMRRH